MDAFQIISFVIATAFYAAYVVKQIALRRRGITADRLAKGDKPAPVRRLETALAAVTLTMPVIQYGSIIAGDTLMPLTGIMPEGSLHTVEKLLPAFRVAGCVIAGVGLMYFISAIAAMRDNWRAGIDASQETELINRGIYRFSRNPAFIGFDLFYVGIMLAFPNPLTLIWTIAAIVLFHFQILNEEKYLSAVWGEKYEKYRRQTLRY